jgi:haloalkane dehalogenase
MIAHKFIDVDGRLVHLREAGQGAPILLIHQSPKSSAEYAELIAHWATTHHVIAPDTPGFGLSQPLADEQATVDDFARALLRLMDRLGLEKTAIYGTHSGAVFAMAAAKLAPQRFTALACNGFAVWTPEEVQIFGDAYLPPFHPSAYGEHLQWLWARMREQRFFFPWYAVDDAHRMCLPEATPAHLHSGAMDMLMAGDAYRTGYRAVVQAKRDLPVADRAVPTLIASYEGDPLRPHLDRLGALPPRWQVRFAPTSAEVEALAFAFLIAHPAPPLGRAIVQSEQRFFHHGLHVTRTGAGIAALVLHDIGSSLHHVAAAHGAALLVDLPGHGLSIDTACLDDMFSLLPEAPITLEAYGLSAVQALKLAAAHPARFAKLILHDALWPRQQDHACWLSQALTQLAPQANGTHLLGAWRRVRDAQFFWPWFDNSGGAAIPVRPEKLAVHALAADHLAALQAHGAPAQLAQTLATDIEAALADCPLPLVWKLPGWAATRADVWRPAPRPGLSLEIG